MANITYWYKGKTINNKAPSSQLTQKTAVLGTSIAVNNFVPILLISKVEDKLKE